MIRYTTLAHCMRILPAVAIVVALAQGSAAAEGTPQVDDAKPRALAPSTPAAELPTLSWDDAALKVAEDLAAKLRAGGVRCDGYKLEDIVMYDYAFRKRLPLPAAATMCNAEGEEDLLFSVFADEATAREFIVKKQAILCRKLKAMKIGGFPGFVYVEGGRWIIEPDEKVTADKLAAILGVKAKIAGCEDK